MFNRYLTHSSKNPRSEKEKRENSSKENNLLNLRRILTRQPFFPTKTHRFPVSVIQITVKPKNPC